MSKLTLSNLSQLSTNENSAITAINSNNATLVGAFDNTLSRDGTAPNAMGADLDMNSHRVLNLPSPSSNNEPVRYHDLLNLAALSTSTSQTYQTLTEAATIVWNLTTAQAADVTLTANRVIGAPTNLVRGFCFLRISQDNVGGRIITSWDSTYTFRNGVIPGLDSIAANASTTFVFYCDGIKLYCQRSADMPVICQDNGSSRANNSLVVKPINGGQVTQLFDGLEVTFRSPVSSAVVLQVGSTTGTLINSPSGVNLLVGDNSYGMNDIKKGSQYAFRYCSNNPYGTGPYWQLKTPPFSETEIIPPLNEAYCINGDGSDSTIRVVGKLRVYDPNTMGFKYLQGEATQNVLVNPTVDGTVVANLPANTVHYVGTYIPAGTGSSGLLGVGVQDVKLNFSNKAWVDNTYFTDVVFRGYISDGGTTNPGTVLTVTTADGFARTPKVLIKVGQVLYSNNILFGTFIGSQLTSTEAAGALGGRGTYSVSQSQFLGYNPDPPQLGGFTGSRKYQSGQDGGAYWIDPLGNVTTMCGILYTANNGTSTSIQSYADMPTAIAAGRTAGSLTASSPFSLYPTQPIPVAGRFTSSHVFSGAGNYEDTTMRIIVCSYDWRCQLTHHVSGNISSDQTNTTVSVTQSIQPLYGSGLPPLSFAPSKFLNTLANQPFPVGLTASNAYGDGAYLWSVTLSADKACTLTWDLNLVCETQI